MELHLVAHTAAKGKTTDEEFTTVLCSQFENNELSSNRRWVKALELQKQKGLSLCIHGCGLAQSVKQ